MSGSRKGWRFNSSPAHPQLGRWQIVGILNRVEVQLLSRPPSLPREQLLGPHARPEGRAKKLVSRKACSFSGRGRPGSDATIFRMANDQLSMTVMNTSSKERAGLQEGKTTFALPASSKTFGTLSFPQRKGRPGSEPSSESSERPIGRETLGFPSYGATIGSSLVATRE